MEKLGIISAIPEEMSLLIDNLEDSFTTFINRSHSCHSGSLFGQNIAAIYSGIGKINASVATMELINRDCDTLLFVGVAGAINEDLRVGDIVVGKEFIQHDVNVEPMFAPYVVPGFGSKFFRSNNALHDDLSLASHNFINASSLIDVQIKRDGIIASGDQFISCHRKVQSLAGQEVDCVDMESAAFAQVCTMMQKPFGVIRVISDHANTTAHHDFREFVDTVAQKYTYGIIEHWLKKNEKKEKT